MIELAIIVPIYNSDKVLNNLYLDLKSNLNEINVVSHIVFVNDGSNDDSWEELINIKKQDNDVTIINLEKNFGQQAATICGLSNVISNYYLTIDDDFEHMPSDIVKLYNNRDKGLVNYGVYNGKKASLLRVLFKTVYKTVSKLIKHDVNGGEVSSFRLINKKMVNHLCLNKNVLIPIDEFILSTTNSYVITNLGKANVPYIKSRYNKNKIWGFYINTYINSSDFILKLMIRIGLFISFFNLILGVKILIDKLFYKVSVDGWASLIVSMLFSTGLIMFFLGILGLYIGRILKNSSQKPFYFISEKK